MHLEIAPALGKVILGSEPGLNRDLSGRLFLTYLRAFSKVRLTVGTV